MISAIEGYIPDRRTSAKQPPAPPLKVDIFRAKWLPDEQQQAAAEESGDPVPAAETQPAEPQIPDPAPSPNPEPDQPSVANSLIPDGFNWVPLATGNAFDVPRDTRQPFSIKKGLFGRH